MAFMGHTDTFRAGSGGASARLGIDKKKTTWPALR
jgi:hypothetical protein